MGKVYDILLDENFDLKIEGGDFVIGESTVQHQEQLLLIEKGELKQFPTGTVGLSSFIDDEGKGGVISEISKQFAADGMQVNKIKIEMGKIEPDAFYKP